MLFFNWKNLKYNRLADNRADGVDRFFHKNISVNAAVIVVYFLLHVKFLTFNDKCQSGDFIVEQWTRQRDKADFVFKIQILLKGL